MRLYNQVHTLQLIERCVWKTTSNFREIWLRVVRRKTLLVKHFRRLRYPAARIGHHLRNLAWRRFDHGHGQIPLVYARRRDLKGYAQLMHFAAHERQVSKKKRESGPNDECRERSRTTCGLPKYCFSHKPGNQANSQANKQLKIIYQQSAVFSFRVLLFTIFVECRTSNLGRYVNITVGISR